MRSFLSEIILPLPFFWILLTAAFVFYQKKSKVQAKRILIVAVIWLAVVSTPFFPDLLVRNLENKSPVFAKENLNGSEKPIHILVLGAGFTHDVRLPSTSQLSRAALSRLTEGIRIYRQLPGSYLVTSAFSGSQGVPQAKVLAQAAVLLGVDSARIKMQTKPHNTWTEATEYKRLFGDSTQLILITSAIHMPRALFLFKNAGLNPIAAPTDFIMKRGIKRWFPWPSASNIQKTEAALHEYLGLFWYKFGGS